MPTYDYACDNCGHTFETFQSMSDDALVTCPSCNNDSLRRLITGGTGVIFRGSGFYVNDSRGASASKSAEKSPDTSADKSTEKGPDTAAKTESTTSDSSTAEKKPKKSEKQPA